MEVIIKKNMLVVNSVIKKSKFLELALTYFTLQILGQILF